MVLAPSMVLGIFVDNVLLDLVIGTFAITITHEILEMIPVCIMKKKNN